MCISVSVWVSAGVFWCTVASDGSISFCMCLWINVFVFKESLRECVWLVVVCTCLRIVCMCISTEGQCWVEGRAAPCQRACLEWVGMCASSRLPDLRVGRACSSSSSWRRRCWRWRASYGWGLSQVVPLCQQQGLAKWTGHLTGWNMELPSKMASFRSSHSSKILPK